MLIYFLGCVDGGLVEVWAVVRGPRRRVPDLDLKMAASSSSAPYPAGAAPWWPSVAGSVAGLRTGGGAQTGRNPWLAMPTTTVATPEGAAVLHGGSIEVPSPPSPSVTQEKSQIL
jgi:hypothetical protein